MSRSEIAGECAVAGLGCDRGENLVSTGSLVPTLMASRTRVLCWDIRCEACDVYGRVHDCETTTRT